MQLEAAKAQREDAAKRAEVLMQDLGVLRKVLTEKEAAVGVGGGEARSRRAGCSHSPDALSHAAWLLNHPTAMPPFCPLITVHPPECCPFPR